MWKQVRLSLGTAHDVRVPHLLGQCPTHGTFSLAISHSETLKYHSVDKTNTVGDAGQGGAILDAVELGTAGTSPIWRRSLRCHGPHATDWRPLWSTCACSRRTISGRYQVGPRVSELHSAGADRLRSVALPTLAMAA